MNSQRPWHLFRSHNAGPKYGAGQPRTCPVRQTTRGAKTSLEESEIWC